MLVVPGELVQIVQRGGVRWAKKSWWYRRPPPWAGGKIELLSVPQLRACLELARTASANFGAKGLIGGLPAIAAKVAEAMAGKSYGGIKPEERRRLRHETVTPATIRKLESLIRRKGGAGLAAPTPVA
ncbi:hypothetical protein J7L00_04270 [Candidatus Bathyarchaeota archaeon]|nr:hypothetical protein [Candidatus Bathyarchaeota archaeon]